MKKHSEAEDTVVTKCQLHGLLQWLADYFYSSNVKLPVICEYGSMTLDVAVFISIFFIVSIEGSRCSHVLMIIRGLRVTSMDLFRLPFWPYCEAYEKTVLGFESQVILIT